MTRCRTTTVPGPAASWSAWGPWSGGAAPPGRAYAKPAGAAQAPRGAGKGRRRCVQPDIVRGLSPNLGWTPEAGWRRARTGSR